MLFLLRSRYQVNNIFSFIWFVSFYFNWGLKSMSTRQLSNKQNTISHTERWKIHVLICGINIHKTTTQQKTKIPKISYKENTGSITVLCRAFCNVSWFMPRLTLRYWSPISCVTSLYKTNALNLIFLMLAH
jgi:hypothetical protein